MYAILRSVRTYSIVFDMRILDQFRADFGTIEVVLACRVSETVCTLLRSVQLSEYL